LLLREPKSQLWNGIFPFGEDLGHGIVEFEFFDHGSEAGFFSYVSSFSLLSRRED
jgi:hypothetical protein